MLLQSVVALAFEPLECSWNLAADKRTLRALRALGLTVRRIGCRLPFVSLHIAPSAVHLDGQPYAPSRRFPQAQDKQVHRSNLHYRQRIKLPNQSMFFR